MYQPYKSGAQRGLEKKMEYWGKKDFDIEFNILTAQALNLAVETMPSGKDRLQRERAKDYFLLLLELRQDPELKEAFMNYKVPKTVEYPSSAVAPQSTAKPEPKELNFVDNSKVVKVIEELKKELNG